VTTKKVTLIAVFLLLLTGLSYQGWSFFNQIACEGQPINNNVAPTRDQQILGDWLIAQSFIAPRPGLNRLDLFFQTYGRRNTHDIILSLYETTGPETSPQKGALRFETPSMRPQSGINPGAASTLPRLKILPVKGTW